jgi:hypothetical protein
MAIHKAKVIGQVEVCGVAPGKVVEIDDEQVYLPALVSAKHVEILEPEESAAKPKPKKKVGA